MNLIILFVLAGLTAWYAWATHRILDEIRRQTKALEEQSNATRESVLILRKSTEDQYGVGQMIVASALQSAFRNIERWSDPKIINLAFLGALPDRVFLIPNNGQSAVEHARVISSQAAVELAGAMDDLRRGEEEMEVLRRLHGRPSHEIEKQFAHVRSLLGSARNNLLSSQKLLREGVKKGL